MYGPTIAGHDPEAMDRAEVRLGAEVARFTLARLIIAPVPSGPMPNGTRCPVTTVGELKRPAIRAGLRERPGASAPA
jgi:hypothetical protein